MCQTAASATRNTQVLPARGFTLLELIVVIAIIATLSAIVAVKTGWIMGDTRRTAAVADMEAMLQASEIIYVTNGKYPQTIEEIVQATDENGKRIGLKQYPEEPWSNAYEYTFVNGEPQVRFFGSDGAEGGEGEAADIVRPRPLR